MTHSHFKELASAAEASYFGSILLPRGVEAVSTKGGGHGNTSVVFMVMSDQQKNSIEGAVPCSRWGSMRSPLVQRLADIYLKTLQRDLYGPD